MMIIYKPNKPKKEGDVLMPYKVKGKIVWHKVGGKWKIKQKATSHLKALATVRLLHGIKHGLKLSHKKRRMLR
jgi:hypothetical protein